jgi:hypothetical protein
MIHDVADLGVRRGITRAEMTMDKVNKHAHIIF